MNEDKVAHYRNRNVRSDFDFIAQRNICLRPGHTGLTIANDQFVTRIRPIARDNRRQSLTIARLVFEIVNRYKIGCGVGYENLRPYSNT